MAAQIPIKNDEDANNIAFDKVVTDKRREVQNEEASKDEYMRMHTYYECCSPLIVVIITPL